MLTLTPAERRALRARAHVLHPVVAVGHHGLTPAVLHEIDLALGAHELIKVRVHSDDRDARETMLASACDALGAAPVQHLGKLLILWRPAPPEAKEAPRAAKTAKKPRKPARPAGHAQPPAASRRRLAGGKRPRADEPKANPYHKRLKREAGAEEPRSGAPAPTIGARAARHRRGASRHETGGRGSQVAPLVRARGTGPRPAGAPATTTGARKRRDGASGGGAKGAAAPASRRRRTAR